MSRPPIHLNALRAFEAAARHRSIKEAALELNVTPSAVSHQIRLLEGLLATNLFERTNRGIDLTDEGSRLLPKLASGFGLITEALTDHHARNACGPLKISVLETFALYWLLPRIRKYPLGRRGFDLRIEATQRSVSFETENVDLAIRLGQGDWPPLASELLLTETLGIYASAGTIESASDETPIFLSSFRGAEWEEWRTRLADPRLAHAPMIVVDSTSLAIKAAIDGAGFCLAGDVVAASEIAAGRLNLIEQSPLISKWSGYWLVYPRGARRDPRIARFRRWLFDEVAGGESPGCAAA